jgi:hypothetical protein
MPVASAYNVSGAISILLPQSSTPSSSFIAKLGANILISSQGNDLGPCHLGTFGDCIPKETG